MIPLRYKRNIFYETVKCPYYLLISLPSVIESNSYTSFTKYKFKTCTEAYQRKDDFVRFFNFESQGEVAI